jgi:hypothetical protein
MNKIIMGKIHPAVINQSAISASQLNHGEVKLFFFFSSMFFSLFFSFLVNEKRFKEEMYRTYTSNLNGPFDCFA